MVSTEYACGKPTRGGATYCAPAKINLTLDVLDRRADGYHDIDTVMAAVDLVDDVTVAIADRPGIFIRCHGEPAPAGPENLAYRAAETLATHAGVAPRLDITLSKRIPPGSGLGGGSSDAAATMKALDYLWGLNWPVEKLAGIGAEIGSDVPFFFHTPVARCQGRGQRVSPIRESPDFRATLVLPGLHVSTRDVYEAFDAGPSRRDPAGPERSADAGQTWGTTELFNALEQAAVRVSPELGRLWHEVESCCGCGFRLSGSGSSLFRLQDSRADAEDLASVLNSRLGVRTETVRSAAW